MAADMHNLTGAYAADVVEDGEERLAFERQLAECPDCREEVRTLREAAAALSVAVALPPPPGLRSRMLAEIAATPQLPPLNRVPAEVTSLAQRRSRRRARVPALAASVVLVAAWAWVRQRVVEMRDAQQAQQRADCWIFEIVGDPNASRVSGPVSGGGSAAVVPAGPAPSSSPPA
jgi:hypothetical protein